MRTSKDGPSPGSGGEVIYLRERFPMAATAQADTETNKDTSAKDERRSARQEMDRYQEDADRRRREVRDRARKEARHGTLATQDAVRSYVRANNRLAGLLTPPGIQRPGEVLRSWFDMQGQMFEATRAVVDEMVQSYRDNIRFLDREAERDERVSRDEAYGWYEEDRQYEDELSDNEREDREDQQHRRRAS